LRVRDIDLNRAQIIVRAAKGAKDRIVMLPASLRQRMVERIELVEKRWRRDVKKGGGYDIRQVQTLLGHEALKTTMLYTHVANRPAISVVSPLDRVM
jgi:site-specific recombinase XerD